MDGDHDLKDSDEWEEVRFISMFAIPIATGAAGRGHNARENTVGVKHATQYRFPPPAAAAPTYIVTLFNPLFESAHSWKSCNIGGMRLLLHFKTHLFQPTRWTRE